MTRLSMQNGQLITKGQWKFTKTGKKAKEPIRGVSEWWESPEERVYILKL